MNLQSFAAEVLAASQVIKTPKAAKDLLPPQQKTRSYKDVEKVEPSGKALPLILIKYYYGEDRGEWTMQYVVRFPIGPLGTDLQKTATNNQIEEFANDYLISRSYRNDYKYVKIKKADKKKIVFVFDVEKWIRDNFNTIRPRFKIPMTLVFPYRISLPLYIRVNSSRLDLAKYIGKKFKEFLNKKSSKLKNRQFSFLKKISADLFMYNTDFQYAEIRATLKYSVILAGIAGYIMYKHKKDMNKKDVINIKKKVSRFGNVKRLDRYLKRL